MLGLKIRLLNDGEMEFMMKAEVLRKQEAN